MKIEEIVNDSEILYSSDEIKVGIANIADAINEYFGDMKDNVTVLPVMKGAIPFAGCLIPQLSFNTNIDYIHVTRYHQNIGTKRNIHNIPKPSNPIWLSVFIPVPNWAPLKT